MSEAGTPPVIGVMGGSGVYDIEGLERAEWRRVDSPFGAPSDELLCGELDGQQMVFLPRHGRGHKVPPTELNFRANIDALKRAGVTDVVSVSAVGSLKEELAPGSFVLVDQFIDRTFARRKSFFETGLVAHVSMADPVCGRLGEHLAAAAEALAIPFARGGTYLVMEGPQFSSRGESELYRSWGCDVIGMTNMPEATTTAGTTTTTTSASRASSRCCWTTPTRPAPWSRRWFHAWPGAASPATGAVTTPSTMPSSPRPRRAIRRSPPSLRPWPAGCLAPEAADRRRIEEQ
jgi:5'-methylthioadenosine phosphorylase